MLGWVTVLVIVILIGIAAFAGTLFYIQNQASKVVLQYVPTERNKNLLTAITDDPYKPLWNLPRYKDKSGLHLKMRMTLKCDMTTVQVGKDVKICAAWYPKPPPKDKTKQEQKFKDKLIKKDVLLVLIPGFAGSQNSWGVAQAAQRAFDMYGWRTVVYNRPGYGAPNLANNGEERYYLHRFDLIEEFIRKVKTESGASKVVILGQSLGGLHGYMATAQLQGLVDAAVVISPILDPETNYKKVDEGDQGFKNWRLGVLKSEVARWIKIAPEEWDKLGINMDLVNSIQSNQEFDHKVVCKTARIPTLQEYYRKIGNIEMFAKISCPFLMISSASDQIVHLPPVEARLKDIVRNNKNVIWAHYGDGGHVEFPVIRSPEKGIECWANIAGLKFLKLSLETAQST